MTKQEQIEEMAKAICSACNDGVATCNRKPCSLAIEEATAVFNLGYRKLPEDSVVLKIKEIEDTCNKCHWVTDYKILKYHEEEVIKLSEQEVKQARKETAKEMYDLCCGHGTTFIKKYLKEKYGVGVEE